jgi:hypothetical protein
VSRGRGGGGGEVERGRSKRSAAHSPPIDSIGVGPRAYAKLRQPLMYIAEKHVRCSKSNLYLYTL